MNIGDPDRSFAISFEDVAAAAFRIRKGVAKTPCEVNLSWNLYENYSPGLEQSPLESFEIPYAQPCHDQILLTLFAAV